jgi:molecular chaperone GrpE
MERGKMTRRDDEEESKPAGTGDSGDTGAKTEEKAEDRVSRKGSEEIEYETVGQEETPPDQTGEKTGLKLPAEEEKGYRAKLKKKDAEIRTLRKELEELRDKYLRKLAEMENLRKRFDREREEFQKYALSDFLRELLSVLDNLERALQNRDRADGKSFQEGIELICRQYLDLLKKKGVRPIEAEDVKFNPKVHQAVLTEESDAVTEPRVAEVFQRGFWIEDRLLRPAMVKVLVPARREGS